MVARGCRLAVLAATLGLIVSFARTEPKPSQTASAAFDRGVAERSQGLQCLEEAAGDPAQEKAKRAEARKHFEAAASAFSKARDAFAESAGTIDPQIKTVPLEIECAACCRCAVAEMELRLGQPKSAAATLAPFFDDPLYQRSRYHHRARYYHGLACFQQGNLVAAGRSLGQLAPFTDSLASLHGRYLLAQVHRLQDELPEAALHFEAVATGIQKLHKDQPPPEFVTRSGCCRAWLLYEQAKYADAQQVFTDLLNAGLSAPLRADARLGLGMTQVQLGQYAEAVETLRPITTKDKVRAPEASLWLGRALLNSTPADGSQNFKDVLAQAEKAFRQSAELVDDKARDDPGKREHRGEALLALATAQQLGGQHRDAVRTLQQIADESLLTARTEEVLQRQISALDFAAQYRESRQLCQQFYGKHPRSVFLPEVLFRDAECATFLARAAKTNDDRQKFRDESDKLLHKLVDGYPEFELANWAQFDQAMARYRKGDIDGCKSTLEKIAATERHGALTAINFALADCQMRTAPLHADDALAAGQLQEQLQSAIDLLTRYVEDLPEPELAAQALLRLGMCKERLGALQAQGEERDKWRDAAREDFKKLLVEYPLHPLQPLAALERSRCLREDDPKQLIGLLRRFTKEPLNDNAVAPLAVLRLATLLRTQDGGAPEAVEVLAKCLADHQKTLSDDARRKGWIPALEYQHAIALMDAGKPAEARALLEAMLTRFAHHPDDALAAEAKLRHEQCRIREGWDTVDRADLELGAGDLSPVDVKALEKKRSDGLTRVRESADNCEKLSEELAKNAGSADVQALLLYQAAWTYRRLAEPEVNEAQAKLRQELQRKLQEEAAKKTPKGQPVPEVPEPEVPLAKVPLQPTEKLVRADYDRLLRNLPEHPLAAQAALELAELYAERDDHAAAIDLLKKALDREPAVELADRLRLRLAACCKALKDDKTALRHLESVASRADSPLAPHAHLLAGECLLGQQKWKDSIKHLVLFRDKEGFQGVGGVSDRALLLLGHGLSSQEKWDESRVAFMLLVTTYGDSRWCNEARYRMAWTHWKQKQAREAQHTLQEMKWDDQSDMMPKARLLLGCSFAERKKYPEAVEQLSELAAKAADANIHALALLELAQVYRQTKKRDEADKLLKEVLEKHPDTPWAAFAKERLKNERDDTAPHFLPAAQTLFAPPQPTAVPLEPLGQQQPLDADTQDPTADLAWTYVLSAPLAERSIPAPLVRLAPVDPFEHRRAVKGKYPKEDAMPLAEKLELPK